jgi:hypothetical protein
MMLCSYITSAPCVAKHGSFQTRLLRARVQRVLVVSSGGAPVVAVPPAIRLTEVIVILAHHMYEPIHREHSMEQKNFKKGCIGAIDRLSYIHRSSTYYSPRLIKCFPTYGPQANLDSAL